MGVLFPTMNREAWPPHSVITRGPRPLIACPPPGEVFCARDVTDAVAHAPVTVPHLGVAVQAAYTTAGQGHGRTPFRCARAQGQCEPHPHQLRFLTEGDRFGAAASATVPCSAGTVQAVHGSYTHPQALAAPQDRVAARAWRTGALVSPSALGNAHGTPQNGAGLEALARTPPFAAVPSTAVSTSRGAPPPLPPALIPPRADMELTQACLPACCPTASRKRGLPIAWHDQVPPRATSLRRTAPGDAFAALIAGDPHVHETGPPITVAQYMAALQQAR